MARTFSVTVETRRSNIRSLVDEAAVVIHADPVRTKVAGGENVSMGFPVLIVSGWVGEPEKFAARVAELLTEAQP